MLLAFLLCLGSAAPAQDPAPVACATCKDLGVLPCKLCATRVCRSEAHLFCSVEGQCSDCGGARRVDCSQCQRAPEVDPSVRRGEIAAWRATLAPLDEFMNQRDLVHVESPHFVLSYDVDRTDHKSASSRHDAAHLHCERLERLFEAFAADAGAVEADFSAKTRVMVWSNEKDQQKASSKYTLEKTSSQAKLMGAAPVVSVLYGKGRIRGDAALHHVLVHQSAHCLLSNLHEGVWVGNLGGGWIDEGVAHLYEQRLCGGVETWCYLDDEQLKELDFGPFEAEVAAAVQSGEEPDFTAVAGLDTVALSPRQRLFGWSYCDYVVRHHPGKLGQVVKVLKRKKPASEALLDGLGTSTTDFQRDWATWVKANYRGKKR
jgi:hypothetical protein